MTLQGLQSRTEHGVLEMSLLTPATAGGAVRFADRMARLEKRRGADRRTPMLSKKG